MVENPPARGVMVSVLKCRRYPEEGDNTSHSSILAGKSHGHRSLVGYSPRGHKESDTTEVT